MTFSELKASLEGRVVFRADSFQLPSAYFSNWRQRGKIVRLWRGIYRLADSDDYDPASLASLLCPDSYITSWTALERYGLTMKSQPNIILSARAGRSTVYCIEGREYRFSQINRKIELPIQTFDSYRIASPPTAFLDLVNRNSGGFEFPQGIKYMGFNASQIRRLQLSTWIRTVRSPLARLHTKVTGDQRRIKARIFALGRRGASELRNLRAHLL